MVRFIVPRDRVSWADVFKKNFVHVLKVFDYIVTIPFWYYCTVFFFNLYYDCFNLFCDVWVCVCVGFVMYGCVYVWVIW